MYLCGTVQPDCKISRNEIANILENYCGYPAEEIDVDMIMHYLDTDRTGFLNKDELNAAKSCWQHCAEGCSDWENYSVDIQQKLEDAWQNDIPEVCFRIGREYCVELFNRVQYRVDDPTVKRLVRRKGISARTPISLDCVWQNKQEGNGFTWQEYPLSAQNALEKAYQANPKSKVELRMFGADLEVDLATNIQTNLKQSFRKRYVRRITRAQLAVEELKYYHKRPWGRFAWQHRPLEENTIWEDYEPDMQPLLEKAFLSREPSLRIRIYGNVYDIIYDYEGDLTVQINVNHQTRRRYVRRITL